MTFRTTARRGYEFVLKPRNIDLFLKSMGYDIVYLLNEQSGSTIVNYGTIGSALNGTLQNAPARVNGPFSGGYDFNASNHGIQIADGTAKDAIESSATLTFSILFKPRSAGPTSSGHIFGYGNADHRLFFNSSMAPRARITRGTTTADTTASTTLATNTLQWLHMVYSSNLISLYRDNGTFSELAYTSQTAGAGTQNSSTNALVLGNRGSLTLNTDSEIYLIAFGRTAVSVSNLTILGNRTPGL